MSESFLANVGSVEKKAPCVNIALLGFGTVGSCFAEVLSSKQTAELRITHIFNRDVARKRNQPGARFVPPEALWTDRIEDVLNDPAVDVIVELIGGLEPMAAWLAEALRRGKHVVTANKQLIAHRGPELFAEARGHGERAAGWWV